MNKGVLRPGHVQLRVLNLESALMHCRELLGLIEADRDEQGRIYPAGTFIMAGGITVRYQGLGSVSARFV